MRYVCLNCGNKFELEEDAKVRCPSCLRLTGIEPLKDGGAGGGTAHRPWVVPVGIAVVLALVAAGYATWRAQAPAEVGDEVPMRPLERDVLLGHLRRLRVEARSVSHLLESDEGIEEMAEGATEGRRTPSEIADGIYQAIRQRAAQQAFTRWSLGVPREAPLADASAVRGWIRDDGARRRLYPLEAAALMVAALRSRGVDGMIAEAWAFPGDLAPPDPSGHFGYFVVAVYEGEAGQGTPALYDPWGGHEVDPEEDDYRVLTDVEVMGAALNLRAIHMLVRENDAARAVALSGDAIRLDGRSPNARSVRAAILIASGGANEGIREFEAAKQLRADAPRHQQVAGVLLAQRDVEGARRELTAALEVSPEYAAAHAALAAVHLAESDSDLALEELTTAQRLDPDLHTLPGLWAGYYATVGELDRAVEHARAAVERSPWDVQNRLMAAQIYRQTGHYDDMRREARAALERSPEGRRAEMEELIRQVLGASALEDPMDEEISDEELLAAEAEEGAGEGDDELRLGDDSMLLGGGGRPGGAAGPSLLPGAELAPSGAGGESLPNLGDPSTLRLGGGGLGGGGLGGGGSGREGIRLDLDEE
jgi:tetratricopeptide (TPR) repeat protein